MSFARRQGELLLTALRFLTRLPLPPSARFDPADPARASRFFPLVGVLVGAAAAAVWTLAGAVWSPPVAAVLALAASAVLTGALHEDGLADTADALGGASPERRLEIMKDSRIGAWGALALVLVTALKAAALAQLEPRAGALALLAAHAGGRAVAVAVMAATPYAGRAAKGRSGEARPRPAELAFALATGAAPLALLGAEAAAVALGLAALAALGAAAAARRAFGGHTGDVLGAAEQLAETLILLAAGT